MYYNNILEVIGNTPLVKINKLNPNPKAVLLAKLEFMNPGGSIKDRIGPAMVKRAQEKGWLKKKGTIIEPTSGNTGLGLAMVAALWEYKTIFVMPDKISEEKRRLLEAYGARIVMTPSQVSPDDYRSCYQVSGKLTREIKGSCRLDQYSNPANPQAHFQTTGPEVWQQTEGRVTHVVIGIGTGGTISGVSRFLKKKNPKIKVIAVDPKGSVYAHYFKTKKIPKEVAFYKTEGVGKDFIPKVIDFRFIDQVITVTDKQAFLTARKLARREGILAGGSSGMALFAAQRVVKKLKRAVVVVIFPDSGRSYLSKIFNDHWMRKNGFLK